MKPNVRPDAGDPAALGGSAEPVAPPHPFTETIQRAVDIFRDGTDEHVLEWREREGHRFVDALTAALARAPQGDPPAQEYHWCETCQEKTVHYLGRPEFVCSRAKEVLHPVRVPAPQGDAAPPDKPCASFSASEADDECKHCGWTEASHGSWVMRPVRVMTPRDKRAGWWEVFRGGMHTGNPQPFCTLSSEADAITVCDALNRVDRGGASSSGSAPTCPECQTRTGQHLVACGYRNDPRYQAASSGSAPPNPGDRT